MIIINHNTNSDVVVFSDTELPNMATHRPQDECGKSVYRNILVQWDEDLDKRVLDFIDQLSDEIREQLVAVQEHEGSLGLVWKNKVPEGYQVGRGVEVKVDIPDVPNAVDVWMILTSKVAGAAAA